MINTKFIEGPYIPDHTSGHKDLFNFVGTTIEEEIKKGVNESLVVVSLMTQIEIVGSNRECYSFLEKNNGQLLAIKADDQFAIKSKIS